MPPIRILIVDDSAFMRLTLSRRLAEEPGFEIAGTARDGLEALRLLDALRPDVVTMDVEMPGLNGLETLAHIMATHPLPVIMVSSKTIEGAEVTVRALTAGAVDFVSKAGQIAGMQQTVQELAGKIRQAAVAKVRALPAAHRANAHLRRAKPELRALVASDNILVIGSSTGGPGALRQLMSELPASRDAAAVIVQHMPAGFTRSLAERLDEVSDWRVKEAAPGDSVRCGQALLAPGGFHLVFNSRGEAALTLEPPENNVRPAVDVTMRSLVEAYGRRVLGVVLTGMGHDGTQGALRIRDAGGQVVAEAEATCAVYGMPRSVVEAGAASFVAPLPEMPALIHRLLRGNRHERC